MMLIINTLLRVGLPMSIHSTSETMSNTASAVSTCGHCDVGKMCFPHGMNQLEFKHFESVSHKYIRLKKKDYVYRVGERLDSIYAIKAGSMKSQVETNSGQKQVLGFHLPGSLIGFDGLADFEHRSDAIALEDTMICELPIKSFEILCEEVPELRKLMMRQLGQEISRQQNIVLTLGQMQTDERLATFLLRLSCYFKERGYSCREFFLPMPRHDLANFLGMAPETLSRMFARFEQMDMIAIQRREIKIIDIEALLKLTNNICKN